LRDSGAAHEGGGTSDSSPAIEARAPSDAGRSSDAGTPIDTGIADVSPSGDASGPVTDAAEGPGMFVAVGYAGRRTRSLNDGVTWVDDQTLEAVGGDDSSLLRAVVAGAGRFLSLGWITMSSVDGKAWDNFGTNMDNWAGSALWDGHQFVIVGGWGMRETSPDGQVWTEHGVSGDTASIHPTDALAMGNGHYLAVADNGMATMSDDGVNWTNAAPNSAMANAHLAFGNGAFVIAAGSTVFRSTDGVKISQVGTLADQATTIAFAQGHFTVLVPGHVYTSGDGTMWTDHPNNLGWGGYSLVYGHGTYIAVDGEGVRRSPDGIAWGDKNTNGSSNPLVAVTYGAL
jgi:hypothetical protein